MALALTTSFTPAPSCTANFYTKDIYYSIGGPSPAQCFPSGWASQSQYFSPGVCPEGYTQACSSVAVAGTVTETQATCCPSGYQCYTPTIFNFPGQACASIFLSKYTTVVTDADASTTFLATLKPSTEAVNGYGVSVRYQSSDFAIRTSSSSSGTASRSTSGSGTAGSQTSTTSATSNSAPDPSLGLSTGAKAGIGAGVGIGALIALVAIVFFIWRKRRTARDKNEGNPDYAMYHEAGEGGPASKPLMKEGEGAHEIYTPPAEMDGTGATAGVYR